MSLRDKYTDEEWSKLEKDSSSRDFSPGWTERNKYQRVVIQSDGDGHEYVIPYLMKDVFKVELNLVACCCHYVIPPSYSL